MTIPHTSSERTIWWYVIRTLKMSVSWPNNSTLENSRKMWKKKYGLTKYVKVNVKVLVIQPCLILWNHMDCSPPGSSVHGILQARIQECSHSLLQKIFLSQALNPGLPQCSQSLYRPSHQILKMSVSWPNNSTLQNSKKI